MAELLLFFWYIFNVTNKTNVTIDIGKKLVNKKLMKLSSKKYPTAINIDIRNTEHIYVYASLPFSLVILNAIAQIIIIITSMYQTSPKQNDIQIGI